MISRGTLMLKHCVVALLLSTSLAAQFGMYLEERPKVTLEQALPIAQRAAEAKVPDLDKFVLHSVQPVGRTSDGKGKYWRFLWHEVPAKAGTRGVFVRVYMNDGSTLVEPFTE
jgi:hypothetical protein